MGLRASHFASANYAFLLPVSLYHLSLYHLIANPKMFSTVLSKVSTIVIHDYFEGRNEGNVFRSLRICYRHSAADSQGFQGTL